jgi:hypothetical protein
VNFYDRVTVTAMDKDILKNSKPFMPEESGISKPFMDESKAVAALRQLADEIEAGTVILHSITNSSCATHEEFVISEVVIEVLEGPSNQGPYLAKTSNQDTTQASHSSVTASKKETPLKRLRMVEQLFDETADEVIQMSVERINELYDQMAPGKEVAARVVRLQALANEAEKSHFQDQAVPEDRE